MHRPVWCGVWIHRTSAIVRSLIGVGKVVMILDDELAEAGGVASVVDPYSIAPLLRDP